MSDFQVNARIRTEKGTADSRRTRLAKKIPAVVYGIGKDNQQLLLDHDEFKHQLEVEAFHNSILKLNAGGQTEQVILREVQMHPFKPLVMHVDFQRISATDKLHMSVPLHFIGEDRAPGVRLEGGIVSHQMNEVEITCLPADLPEYIEVDVTNLALNESIHMSALTLPAGVEFTAPAEGESDHPVVSIVMPKVSSEDLADDEDAADEAERKAAADDESDDD